MYTRTRRVSWAHPFGNFPHLVTYERPTDRTHRDGREIVEEVEIHTSNLNFWPAQVEDLRALTTLGVVDGHTAIWHWRE
jgi:hypothetical protein